MAYLCPRKRPRLKYWDKDISEVELRHLKSDKLKDEQVLQVSGCEWLVTCEKELQVYAVERVIRDDEVLVTEHNLSCEFWAVDDTFFINEGYCRSCFLCCHLYNCDCPDEHPLCVHVHRVHAWTEQQYVNQRPHDLEMTIKSDLERLRNVAALCTAEKKEEFAMHLFNFVKDI